MTIASQPEFEQALCAVSNLYRLLDHLRQETRGSERALEILSEGPLDEIARIEADIDAYVGASPRLGESHFWMRLIGRGIQAGDAPASVLSDALDSFRKGVQSVAEMISKGTLSTRPTAELLEAADLRVVALAPGSLRVGLRLPAPEQPSLMKTGSATEAAEQALSELLTAAEWAASPTLEDEWLAHRIADGRRRRLVLSQLSNVVPSARGPVDEVELSGPRIRAPQPIRLLRSTRARVEEATERTLKETRVTYEGYLREIDLDKRHVHIRSEGGEKKCLLPEDLLGTARVALNHRVRVIGTQSDAAARAQTSIEVAIIEIIGGEPDAADGGPSAPT